MVAEAGHAGKEGTHHEYVSGKRRSESGADFDDGAEIDEERAHP
jgi:hypothetical protein